MKSVIVCSQLGWFVYSEVKEEMGWPNIDVMPYKKLIKYVVEKYEASIIINEEDLFDHNKELLGVIRKGMQLVEVIFYENKLEERRRLEYEKRN